MALSLVACGGEPADTGLDEPIILRLATFKEGELPGEPPLTTEQIEDGVAPTGSRVTIVDSQNNVLRPGQTGKTLSGRATDDSTAVGMRIDGQGEGYWITTLGPPDPSAPGELTWKASLDVAHDLEPGLYTLLLAGIREDGTAGTQFALPVCVRSAVPDNFHACNPDLAPPAAVFSLAWDANVDLDLLVVTPSGKFVDPKHPTTSTDGEVDEGDGIFDHDGLGNCVIGNRRENLVFQEKPEKGTYYVFVNVFDGCGVPATRFDFTLHLDAVEALRVSGEALGALANGGTELGTYVTEFIIQ